MIEYRKEYFKDNYGEDYWIFKAVHNGQVFHTELHKGSGCEPEFTDFETKMMQIGIHYILNEQVESAKYD